MFELSGAKVAICGSFGGIGQEICKELLDAGVSHLATLDVKINKDILNGWKQSYPNQIIVHEELDVTQKSEVDSVLRKVKDEMCGLDVFINCCGILNERRPDMTIQLGTIFTTLASIELMGVQNGGKGGTVVNVASVLGLEPCLPLATYSASKHGIIGFSRCFSNDFHLNKTGVRILTICPGLTNTSLVQGAEYVVADYTKEIVTEMLGSAQLQEPNICAKNIVKALQDGKHGSIWICDLGSLCEITIPLLWEMTC